MPEAGQTKGAWSVLDKNATMGARRHQAVSGVHYDLHASKKTYMPAKDAATFLRDSSFEVYNEDGVRMAHTAPKPDGHQGITLQPGQVIANLEELTATALLVRAHQTPGGEGFQANAKKADLVEFLTTVDTAQAPAAKRRQAAGDAEGIEDVAADEVAEIAAAHTPDDDEIG